MYQNYVFDFGQVIIRFEPDQMTAPFLPRGEDFDLVRDVVFDRLYWDRLDDGSVTDEQVLSGICSRLPARLQEPACAIYRNWHLNTPLIDGMEEIIRKLHEQGKHLYLLSNVGAGFAEHYAENPAVKSVFDHFDGLVFSGTIRMAKPHREIFEYLLGTYSLDPAASLFIDDRPKNIAAAQEVGMGGYLFDGDVPRLKKFLLG